MTRAVRRGATAGFVITAEHGTFHFYSREGAVAAGDSTLAPRLILENASHVVGPAGGTIRAQGGRVVLEVPPGALTQNVPIDVTPAPIEESLPLSGLIPGTLHDFGPSGLEFAVPAMLSIAYDPNAVPPEADPASLVILSSQHGDSEPLTPETSWEERPSTALSGNVIRGSIEHFSHDGVGEPVLRMEIAPTELNLFTGQTLQLVALPFGPADKPLNHATTWTSAATNIANVVDAVAGGLQLGDVTGVSAGSTTVTATATNSAEPLTASKSIPVTVSGATLPKQHRIAVGFHVCWVRSNGELACQGSNQSGQLGNGTTTDSDTPVVVPLTGVISVVAAFDSTCALLSDGTVWCWGTVIGVGPSTVPVQIAGLTNVIDVDIGTSQVCAVRADGTAYCWGANNFGQLGDGTTVARSTPTQVLGLTTAIRISGGGGHTCAVLADSTAACWGQNNHGQLGDGTTMNALTPVPVRRLDGTIFTGFADISLAEETHHGCAILTNGTGACWGENLQSTLGDGTTVDQHAPSPLVAVNTATLVTAFNRNGCVLLANATVQCWGLQGVLGNGATAEQPTVGAPVTDLLDAVDLDGHEGAACALRATGEPFCWGMLF